MHQGFLYDSSVLHVLFCVLFKCSLEYNSDEKYDISEESRRKTSVLLLTNAR